MSEDIFPYHTESSWSHPAFTNSGIEVSLKDGCVVLRSDDDFDGFTVKIPEDEFDRIMKWKSDPRRGTIGIERSK